MDASHLKQLVDLEDTYWWHVAKRELAVKLLEKHCPPPGRLVEGGIGSGRNLVVFQELGYEVTGLDLMPESVEHVRARGIEDSHVHDLQDPWPMTNGSVNAIVLLDVLEHIEHPVRALQQMHNAFGRKRHCRINSARLPMAVQSLGRTTGALPTLHGSGVSSTGRGIGVSCRVVESLEQLHASSRCCSPRMGEGFPHSRNVPDFPEVSSFTNSALLTAAAAERWCMNRLPVPRRTVAGGSIAKMIAPVAAAHERSRHNICVSAVLPVYNEVAVLRELTQQICSVLEDNCGRFEIVFVNDGSSDGSRDVLDQLAAEDDRVVVLHLARNFGHQPALHAGLEHARGDAVIVMDSDLQDDPKAIVSFLDEWEAGFDVVYAQRFNRKESLPKRVLFYSFLPCPERSR